MMMEDSKIIFFCSKFPCEREIIFPKIIDDLGRRSQETFASPALDECEGLASRSGSQNRFGCASVFAAIQRVTGLLIISYSDSAS
jgi:hypothetical protein